MMFSHQEFNQPAVTPVRYMVKNSFLDFVGDTEFGIQENAQRCRAATSEAAFFVGTPKAKQEPQVFNVNFQDGEPESEPIASPTSRMSIRNNYSRTSNKMTPTSNRRPRWSSFSEEEEDNYKFADLASQTMQQPQMMMVPQQASPAYYILPAQQPSLGPQQSTCLYDPRVAPVAWMPVVPAAPLEAMPMRSMPPGIQESPGPGLLMPGFPHNMGMQMRMGIAGGMACEAHSEAQEQHFAYAQHQLLQQSFPSAAHHHQNKQAHLATPATVGGSKKKKEREVRESHVKESAMNESKKDNKQKECDVPEHMWSTVMIQHLPDGITQDILQNLLNTAGFAASYDFLYLPKDFRTAANIGYAFVNFVEPTAAQRFITDFEQFGGFRSLLLGGSMNSDDKLACEVTWSRPHQGIESHIQRYQNSPVMHANVPREFKPRLFAQGVEISFPPPTKTIKAPKLRPARR